mmetsp:Transcript_3816/g.4673  ORF Transcript_3816/g.4673 Transcript_3816/m.4673 type:complete len:181 (+) Transcript_3816:50-592(+)|eukprot:CAMPEP_0203672872 /NCGR_PEP_ID=MMETSP0090-20130426/9635_1 /ASSEMBLY_ACC=CAM_ASM_001088 /TAXON_ID=426623 /ORGANISM="Chaetoceros affinis, Strain CCMP159" /LENGTH=180 /DNA_ID=CAMNT_0050538307 /DNA_START=33 /DNA_END=575 /DNA_ORIENTATION=-
MRNSWLSFTIPNEIRSRLHDIALNIASKTKFDPMPYNYIHMTAVFLGNKTRVTPEMLDIVAQYDLSGAFRFDRLEYFPPSKLNLIVAIFETDNSEIAIKLAEMRKQLKNEFGFDMSERDLQAQLFVPHFTLGKLNLTKRELDYLINTNFLQNIENEIENKGDFMFEVEQTDSPLHLCGGT